MATLRYFVERSLRGGSRPAALRLPAFVRTLGTGIRAAAGKSLEGTRFGDAEKAREDAWVRQHEAEQRAQDLKHLSRLVQQQADVLKRLGKTKRWTDDTTAEVRDVAQTLLDAAERDLRRHNPPLL